MRGAKTVKCPYCDAPVGEPCRRSDYSPFRRRGGATVPQAHQSRVQLARERRTAAATMRGGKTIDDG